MNYIGIKCVHKQYHVSTTKNIYKMFYEGWLCLAQDQRWLSCADGKMHT